MAESFFFLNLANTSLHNAVSCIGIAKLIAARGNVSLKGIDETTDAIIDAMDNLANFIDVTGGGILDDQAE